MHNPKISERYKDSFNTSEQISYSCELKEKIKEEICYLTYVMAENVIGLAADLYTSSIESTNNKLK